jgi:hypothetical protein
LGGGDEGLQPPTNRIFFKKVIFHTYDYVTVLRHLLFSRKQPLKSADDYYIGILKNKVADELKEKDRPCDLNLVNELWNI